MPSPLFVFLIVLAECLALGKTHPWSDLPFQLGRTLWVGATIAAIAVLLNPQVVPGRIRQRIQAWGASRGCLVALATANGAMALANFVYFRRFGYTFPWAVLAVALTGAFAVRADRFSVSVLLGLGFLLASILHFPLNPERSDMLPAIDAALDAWSHGVSPYAATHISGKDVPMPYLPGTLFAHIPAWILGIDLRWNELLYRAGWTGLLALGARKLPAGDAWRGTTHLIILNPFMTFRHELYFDFFLLLVVTYQAFPQARWLAIPALIVTRQWAWVMAPFMVLDWLLGRRPVQRAAALLTGTACIFATAAVLLERSTTAAQFASGIFFSQRLAKLDYQGDYGLTLVPPFFSAGLAELLQPLQGAIVAAAFGSLLWRWGRNGITAGTARSMIIHGAGVSVLCLFVMLNIQFWNYFWITPAVWVVSMRVWQPDALNQTESA